LRRLGKSFGCLKNDFEVLDNSFAVKRQNPHYIYHENGLQKFGFISRLRDFYKI